MSKIFSYYGGTAELTSIVSAHGFINAWSSENRLVSGTTTTVYDYGLQHDLANPASTNQPTLNASDALFGSKPSFTFDGTSDYFYKSTPNFRGSDNSGVITFVVRASGTRVDALDSGDEGSNYHFKTLYSGNRVLFDFFYSFFNSIRGTTVISNNTPFIVSIASTGTAYKMFLNGATESFTVVAGSNDGKWYNDVPAFDNITIGALRVNVNTYAAMTWVFSGYTAYTNDAAVIALQAALKNYYGF